MKAGLALSSRVECNVQSRPELLGLSNPASASLIAGAKDGRHHFWLVFCNYFVQMGFHHVAQAGLELLTSGDAPTSASQSAAIIGVSHSTPA